MRIGILCGGGPAPGFNGVIESVVVAARRRGWTVIGIPYGYEDLMAGNTDRCRALAPGDVEGIATRGGGILYTSRANPTKSPEKLAAVVASVRRLELQALVTIGGDDTATSAAAVGEAIGSGFRVAHVPKTIDNDLPLPGMVPTFGFETAKHLGARICKALRTDARITGRWYLVTAMGRSAGHLSLAMGTAAEADLVVIAEEFGPRLQLADVAGLVESAIEIRRGEGQGWGLVVLHEGILERLEPDELRKHVGSLEIDEHGNPRMSEIDLGRVVRDVVAGSQKTKGHKVAFVTKIVGYELRSADPIGFDVQYTRALGAGAVAFLAEGEGHAMVTLREDRIEPLRLDELRDPATGRIPVRRVDTDGALWRAALALQARR